MPTSEPTAPDLIVIRHAQSEWNAIGRWQGHSDPPLSALGQAQAADLARELASTSPDRIEVSDLLRARQTAAALLKQWNAPARTDSRYRELDLGEWSGLTRQEIEARDPAILKPFDARVLSAAAPGGESREQFYGRVEAALVDLCERCAGETVAIVTHGGFVYSLFPDADVRNASAHRGRADVLLAGLRARRAAPGAAGDDSAAF